MDTDSGFWILETEGRRVLGRVGAAWILDSWILDTGRSVGGPGREGRRTLDSGFWILGRRSREGRPSDSGFWILETEGRRRVGAAWILDSWILDSAVRHSRGFWILGFWILPSATRHGLDSGFLDSGNCQNPESRCADSGSWILDSGFCPTDTEAPIMLARTQCETTHTEPTATQTSAIGYGVKPLVWSP